MELTEKEMAELVAVEVTICFRDAALIGQLHAYQPGDPGYQRAGDALVQLTALHADLRFALQAGAGRKLAAMLDELGIEAPWWVPELERLLAYYERSTDPDP